MEETRLFCKYNGIIALKNYILFKLAAQLESYYSLETYNFNSWPIVTISFPGQLFYLLYVLLHSELSTCE